MTDSDLTRTLLAFSADTSNERHCNDLMDAAYEELRRMAGHLMRAQKPDHTLQATALVHEAYIKLIDQSKVSWKDKAHFMGVAVTAMRHILIDNARRKQAEKRGGGWARITFTERLDGGGGDTTIDILDLDKALEALAKVDERAAKVAELRVIGGLTIPEAAEVLSVSSRTIDNDWSTARLWLTRFFRDESKS